MHPEFIYNIGENDYHDPFEVYISTGTTTTGLLDKDGMAKLDTPIYGYGSSEYLFIRSFIESMCIFFVLLVVEDIFLMMMFVCFCICLMSTYPLLYCV